jgi:hypothetical protein
MENYIPNTVMALFFVAVAVMFIAGLAVIPALQEAQAANAISTSRDKGAQGELMSDGKRQGNGGSGGGGGCQTCG